jgi:protein disulfide-isomerase-like protein
MFQTPKAIIASPRIILKILKPKCKALIIKMSKILGFIFLAITIQLSASHYVLELTDSNFQETLDKYPSIMIDFYASWCGHCQHFKPIYEKASIALHNKGSVSVLARVDAYYYTDIKHAWKIGGYPTILYFQHGQLVEKYPGQRKVEDLLEYLESQEKKLDN